MDKKEIAEILDAFPYDRSEYWIVTGAAMVLYGIKEQTSDIDMGCTENMADSLERGGYLCGVSESGNRSFRYGEHIEIFENWLKDSVAEAGGFPVISVRGLVEMKKELGREKDMKDIELLNEYISRGNQDGQMV